MQHKPSSPVTSGGGTRAWERDGRTGVPGTTWGAGRASGQVGEGGRARSDKDVAS